MGIVRRQLGNDHHLGEDIFHCLRGIYQPLAQLQVGICQQQEDIGQLPLGTYLRQSGIVPDQWGIDQGQMDTDQHQVDSDRCRVGICQLGIGLRLQEDICQTGSGLIRRQVGICRRGSGRQAQMDICRLGTDLADGRHTGHHLNTGRRPGSGLRLAGIDPGRLHYYHLEIKGYIKTSSSIFIVVIE